ncbi:MAG: peptidylprolyl isomerase [Candidatus Krumholzibacteriota bacterium]|nr:peptidylprolyl isomerase [Candidatus Krumholzibacteriota bacterium]
MFRTRIFTLLVAMVLMGFTAGCGGGESDQAADERIADRTLTGKALEGDQMVVTVNGEKITEAELDHELGMMMQQMAGSVDPQQLESMKVNMRKQTVWNMVNQRLLSKAAEREGVTVTAEEKEAKLNEIKMAYPSDEEYERGLRESNMNEKDLLSRIEKLIKLEKLMDKQTAHLAKVTPEEVSEYYQANADRFRQPERVQASHILLKFEPQDDDASKELKKQKLEKIHLAVLAGGDFAKLAEENSDCPSSANGGDLGFFARGQMVKPFEDMAFALKPGDVSGIFETQFGYHIVKVTAHEDPRTIPLEEARENIVNYLETTRKQEEMNRYVNALRQVADIQYADSSLAVP